MGIYIGVDIMEGANIQIGANRRVSLEKPFTGEEVLLVWVMGSIMGAPL